MTAARSARLAFPALIAGAIGIAFAPIFVRWSSVDPVSTAFWRVLLALPVMAAMMAWGGRRTDDPAPTRTRQPTRPRDFAGLLLAGAFFAGDLGFWHWSIAFTSVANSTLLANFAPVFVTLGAWWLFGARFQPLFFVGLALGMAGAITLMADSISIGIDTLIGDGLGLITAVFYAAYILSVGRLRARYSTATVMTWSGVGTVVILLPVALLTESAFWPQSTEAWAVLLGLALISHAAGQSLIAFALAHLPAALGSLSLLIQPVMAAGLAWILLAEALGWLQALGGAIVLAGILIARRAGKPPG